MKNYLLFILLIIVSCNQSKENEKEVNNSSESKVDSLNDKGKSEIKGESEDELELGLEEFMNMEQVEFCISLPLKKYKLNEEMSDERAKFVFTDGNKHFIQVQGMFRSEPSVSIDEYFENTYISEKTEELGKIVEEKEIVKNKNCFWAFGYMSNEFQKEKFIEITWLRKDEVIVLSWNFNIEEEKQRYKKILNYLINKGVDCNL